MVKLVLVLVHTDISTCVYTFGTSGLSVAIRCWWHCFCYCKTRCMIDLCIRCNRSPTTGLCKTNGWSRQVWEVNLQGDLLQTHNLRLEMRSGKGGKKLVCCCKIAIVPLGCMNENFFCHISSRSEWCWVCFINFTSHPMLKRTLQSEVMPASHSYRTQVP